MSQIKFKTQYNGSEVEVMAGYDVPLNDYYMTVFDKDEESVWSTLDHYTATNKPSIEDLKDQLDDMGIVAPEGFWDYVALRLGNFVMNFNGDWKRS